jgi:hypothetical protein
MAASSSSNTPKKTNISWKTQDISLHNFLHDFNAGRYVLDTEWQRGDVHNIKWKQEVIQSLIEFNLVPTVYFQPSEKRSAIQESIDGRQRCEAILQYLNNKYEVACTLWENKSLFYRDLPIDIQDDISMLTIPISISSRTLTEHEIAKLFSRLQQTKKTSLGEHLNSKVSALSRGFIKDILNTHEDTISGFINRDRHNHIEFVLRCMYLFVNFKESITSQKKVIMDTTPKKLNEFYETLDLNNDEKEAFVFIFKKLIQILLAISTTTNYRVSTKGTYLSILRLLLEYQTQEFTTVFFIQQLKKCLGSEEMLTNKLWGQHNSCETTYQKLKYVFDNLYE